MATIGTEPSEGAAAKFHPSLWLIVPTLSLLLGQALATLPWTIPHEVALAALAPLLLCVLRRWRGWSILTTLSLLALSTGYIRHWQLLHPIFADNHIRTVAAREATLYLEGVLREEPERLINRTRWRLRAERVWHPTGAEEICGDILLGLRTVRRDWRYGDRVRLRVRPQAPRDSGNPGGFDYATYLARRAIYATGFLDSDQEIELVAREAGILTGFIEDLRRQIRRYLDRSFAGDNGGLMKALVLGDMGGISKELRFAFTAAGVNHVLSISGLHVAMLGVVVFALIRYGLSFSSYLLLRWNLLKIATFFSFLAVVFYTVLAGAMVPTVRSAIMIGVYELAVLLDREEEVFTSLTLAALLIGLVWPGVIADISFQLSFLAVLFIVWGMRRLHQHSQSAKSDELAQEKSRLKEALCKAGRHLAVPLLATLGTGPLIAHYFGHLSFAGFIANPVIVPLVGFLVVPLGLTTAFLSLALPDGLAPLVWLVETLSGWTIWLVDRLARLPLANVGVPAPNPLEVGVLYGLLLCAFIVRRKSQAAVALVIGLAIIGADGLYWWHERQARTALRITHLNVGQGDAAVVELPGGKVLLIDAGGVASGDFDTGEAIVAPFLRRRKIVKVDYLVVSHARIDHYGGMRAIVNEFAPAEFWSGGGAGRTARFEELEYALERTKTPKWTLSSSQPCKIIERANLCVLFGGAEGADDASVVLRIEFGAARFLFSGDIDRRDEARLANRPGDLRSAVVKIPRHGSATASSDEFVAAVRPRLAILSAGPRSRAEAKRDEVIERYRQAGAQVLRTYEDGAIIVETDGKTLRYQGYKSGKSGELTL